MSKLGLKEVKYIFQGLITPTFWIQILLPFTCVSQRFCRKSLGYLRFVSVEWHMHPHTNNNDKHRSADWKVSCDDVYSEIWGRMIKDSYWPIVSFWQPTSGSRLEVIRTEFFRKSVYHGRMEVFGFSTYALWRWSKGHTLKSGVIDKKHLGSEQRALILLLVSLEQELIYLCTPRVHTPAVLLGLSLYGESPETRVVKEQVHSHLWESILVCHLGFFF